MANIKLTHTETFTAGAALTSYQYHGMKMSANRTCTIFSADTDIPVGVLQNAPGSGEEAEVLVMGRTPVVLGGTVAAGERIHFDSSGHAVKNTAGTSTTQYCAGICTIGGDSGEVGEAIVNCGAPGRGA